MLHVTRDDVGFHLQADTRHAYRVLDATLLIDGIGLRLDVQDAAVARDAATGDVLAGVDGRTSSRQLVEHNLAGTINVLEYARREHESLVLKPNRAYGGASNALAQVLNIATPTDTQYQVTDVAREYDFWADLPTGRLNSIALLNAIAASATA